MAHKFHQTQKTYMLAKAAIQTVMAEHRANMAPHAHLLDGLDDLPENEIDAKIAEYTILEEASLEKYDVAALTKALRLAEDMMMEWAHEKVSCHKMYAAHRATFTQLYETIKKPGMSRFRQQVIDLSARLK